MNIDLKKKIRCIAGYLSQNEALDASDAQSSVQDLVIDVASENGISALKLALISVALAEHIDKSKS